jgi:hypothetical protein
MSGKRAVQSSARLSYRVDVMTTAALFCVGKEKLGSRIVELKMSTEKEILGAERQKIDPSSTL